jgi:hypothetical protein
MYRLHLDTAEAAYLSVSVAAAAHSVGVDGDTFGSSIGDAIHCCPVLGWLFDSLSGEALRVFTREFAFADDSKSSSPLESPERRL